MESGVNKLDDLSGASAPEKFDRKTLIDSTQCTEHNVKVHSKYHLEVWKTKCTIIATTTDLHRIRLLSKPIQKYSTHIEEKLLHSLHRHNA